MIQAFFAKINKTYRCLIRLLIASGFFYDLDVCHGGNFNNTCSPRVTRTQLTNNMLLFSANGTNSSILTRGDFVTFYVTLSESVPMFSTNLSKFYVSTVFLLHCEKMFFIHTKLSEMRTDLFVFTWRKRKFYYLWC